MSTKADFELLCAENFLREGLGVSDAKQAIVHIALAAADCHAFSCGQTDAESDLKALQGELVESVVHLRERRRKSTIKSTAGFCNYCWRVTDRYRGIRYICEVHRGGSKSSEAKKAIRLHKKSGKDIRQTELEILNAMQLITEFQMEDHRRVPDILSYLHCDVAPPPYRSPERDICHAAVSHAEAPAWLTFMPLAFKEAGIERAADAAVILSRRGITPSQPESDALVVALERTAKDRFYTGRVLARAEAFLRHMR